MGLFPLLDESLTTVGRAIHISSAKMTLESTSKKALFKLQHQRDVPPKLCVLRLLIQPSTQRMMSHGP